MAQPNRLILDNVPRINFYEGGPRCPEDIPLPSVMRALMEYFNESDFGCQACRAVQPGCKVPCSYAYFMGMTAAGSYLSWKKGWQEDNLALSYMDPDPAAADRRAFNAAGYAWEYVEKQENGATLEQFTRRIAESLQRGIPVVAYGVVGPPEPCIITGYDESGAVLIGWSFFQNFPEFNAGLEFEPCGYFRKRNWLPDTKSLVIIGDKQTRLPFKTLYHQALEAALHVTRTPIMRPEPDAPESYRQRANGLAAYDAWASQLLADQDFPDDENILRQRHDVHNAVVGHVAEARWYSSLFFIQASDPDILHYSMAEDLLHAAACYAAEHNLMWKLWELAGGNGYPQAYQLFADPGVRRQMVPIIHEARRQDEQAALHLQKALSQAPAG